jgi:cation diffusion facilitator family transporter
MKNNHRDSHQHKHKHVLDPAIISTERGIWAVKWSFVTLMVTALFQVVVVFLSGSIALLADTIHNFGDAVTAIPLWFAFALARKQPSERFSYGYGRVEDLAGLFIVAIIFSSAVFTAYHSIQRLLLPRTLDYLWVVIGGSCIGFLGNEAVALFRIKVGKEIGSAALVADGYHARVDGLTSLSVLLGALGVWLGYPLADPVVGLAITVLILRIVWTSARSVFIRLLDGVEPEILDNIRRVAANIQGVGEVGEVRVRWLGHRLHAEVEIGVKPGLSVEQGHHITVEVDYTLQLELPYISNSSIHIYPLSDSNGKTRVYSPQSLKS